MKLQIITAPDERLNKISDVITRQVCRSPWLRCLAREMALYVRERQGLGLAAVQCGYPYSFIVVNHGRNSLKAYCNPSVIEPSPETSLSVEACYSLPGKEYEVERHDSIVVLFRSLDGKENRGIAQGRLARILQHEIDHVNGILICNRGNQVKETQTA